MFCKCNLVGYVARDCEISPKNENCVRFSIAYTSTHKGEDGSYQSQFINCACFDRTAKNALNYLKKGDLVYCDGNLDIAQYTDKNGNTKTATTLLVGMFRILSNKADRENRAFEKKHYQNNPPQANKANDSQGNANNSIDGDNEEDEIPF